ncbi:MAG: HAMP domain-containing histidine kinase [Clostridia bacterium]|nr:HAMP domain-containing histidine kinase [Clostridia bacterium]
MLFSIGILMVSSVILMLFDHHSRYSFFFILMAVGSIFSLFSLVFHISVFGNYYFYTTNPLYVLDYRMYSSLVQRFHFPLSVVLRFMNAGLFLYQISNCLFALELHACLRWYRAGWKAGTWIHRLVFAVPVITLIYFDPYISNRIYVFCHLHAAAYPLLQTATVLYKAMSLAVILLPVCDLVAYACVIRLPYLCRRIVLLAVMLAIQHTGYALLFYFGAFSISAEKVYRSGYWIFETQQASAHSVYLPLPMATLFLMVVCLAILLSFRLDLSMRPFLGKTVQKNLTLMNNTLGDMLHSHKNQLFTQHIYIEKLKKRSETANLPDLQKLDRLVNSSLEDTARMLDRLNDQHYRFKPCDLSSIVQQAVEKTFFPEQISVRIDESVFHGPLGYFDRYHLEQALINILNNAVEAVEKAHREHPAIRISTAYFFRWVVVMITDNGIGISPAEKRKLFLPHYSSKNGRLNWGLGLTYVYRIVDAHLGQIKISSRKGEYTSVMLMLPTVEKGKKQ